MIVLTLYYEGCLERLQTLFDSIAHFDVAKGYKIVLLATHKIPMTTQIEIRECALACGFDDAFAIETDLPQSWPEAANGGFYYGARWIQSNLPESECFMLLEHDCTITGPKAFSTIHDDWRFHGTPICGVVNFIPSLGLFIHGVAVYQTNIIDLVGADNITGCGDKPYDVYLREWLLPLSSHTHTLCQTGRLGELPLDSCLRLAPNTLIHHSCKDKSLFRSILTHEWEGKPLRMRDAAPIGVSDDDASGLTCLSRASCSRDSWSVTVSQLKKTRAPSGPGDGHP